MGRQCKVNPARGSNVALKKRKSVDFTYFLNIWLDIKGLILHFFNAAPEIFF